ncbi:MFS transporter [Penicillium verrucosum]|uniref:MFS transporter n=1 Tax=Penicillium verrucosum TaxID=60171 RepID=UPI0025455638|nr:MFS transporter [Penicillium verrucosum]KAJ5920423.1 MFS transporter [Penicillium verrucosum]
MGYTNAGPLVGNICVVYGGFLSNGSILYYTKRNKDYHEPEMRLYILRLPAVFMCAVCTNTHFLITGDAFTVVALMRNAVSIAIPFATTPWIQCNGIQNMFMECGMMSLAISGMIIPMVIWGKSTRRALTKRYLDIVERGHAV